LKDLVVIEREFVGEVKLNENVVGFGGDVEEILWSLACVND